MFVRKSGCFENVVYEEDFLQERLRPFSKNGCNFKREVAFKEESSI